MKTLFFSIDGVFHLGSFSNVERIVKYHQKQQARYIMSDAINRTTIKNLNKLMGSVSNLWLVSVSNWNELFTLNDIKEIFSYAGFNYCHRLLDCAPKIPGVKTTRVALWLRENAEVNEVNSFAVVSAYPPKGLFDQYSIQTSDVIGLSDLDIGVLINNFNHQAYRLSAVWKNVTQKGH
jgi:hypothetical protein